MEQSTPENLLCDGHAKAMQQCLTDIFTSVYTTCEIRENSIFGPCVLSHTSMYDSIAFIGLKSSDKRTSPYVFRVDTSTANSSSQSRMWLRLVQSARDNDERNLEAYVKNGQLFYRSLRRIEKNEELLVWYGKDLMELLLLRSHRAPGETKESPPYCCSHCSQRFQFEFPYLAHLRFHCSKRPQSIQSAEEIPKQSSDYLSSASAPSSPKMNRSEGRSNFQDGKPATDFHNLARDLENNTNCQTSDKEAEVKDKSTSKRKLENIEDSSGSFLQPLALKADSSNTPSQYRGAYISGENRRSFRPSSPEPTDTKRSAFTEVKKAPNSQKHSSKNLSSNSENKNSRPNCSIEEKLTSLRPVLTETQPQPHVESSSTTSAFTSVLQQVAGGERKSAFSQPSHSLSHLSHLVMTPKLLPSLHCHPAIGSTASANRIYQSDSLQGSELLQGALPKHSPFLYATAFWPKSSGPVQMQIPSSLTLLPPSFASLCLPAQNWCAKCNASFRMTSDLVYHMRSHHKKEFSMEPLVKRRREEKLKCPICSESFRERHHLSRHMTSHN